MNRYLNQQRIHQWLVAIIISILAAGGLVACSVADQPAALPVVTAVSSPSRITTLVPNPSSLATAISSPGSIAPVVPSPRITFPPPNPTVLAAATLGAHYRSRLATSIALSPVPPTERYPTPDATYTPELGMLLGCPLPASQSEPQGVNCWQGMVNGSIGLIEAGIGGRYSDPLQGILIYQPHYYDYHEQYTYNTPQRVGAVRIVAVAGLRVTWRLSIPMLASSLFSISPRASGWR